MMAMTTSSSISVNPSDLRSIVDGMIQLCSLELNLSTSNRDWRATHSKHKGLPMEGKAFAVLKSVGGMPRLGLICCAF